MNIRSFAIRYGFLLLLLGLVLFFYFFITVFFLSFGLWVSDFLIFDLKIGFLVKNCMYRQLGMSGIKDSYGFLGISKDFLRIPKDF